MLATYSFRRKQDFWGAIQRKSLTLVEKIRVLTKSCKNPRLFDLFSGLTIGLLELFLDHQMQILKQNQKVSKSAYTKNAQKTLTLTERLRQYQRTFLLPFNHVWNEQIPTQYLLTYLRVFGLSFKRRYLFNELFKCNKRYLT